MQIYAAIGASASHSPKPDPPLITVHNDYYTVLNSAYLHPRPGYAGVPTYATYQTLDIHATNSLWEWQVDSITYYYDITKYRKSDAARAEELPFKSYWSLACKGNFYDF